MSKPIIGITESEPQYMAPFIDIIEKSNGKPFPIYPEDKIDIESTLEKLDGLLIGGGPDIHPSEYGELVDVNANVSTQVERDAVELPLLKAGMSSDMPILCVCRGMQALNIVLGGKLIQDLGDKYPGHGYSLNDTGNKTTSKHRIFIAPGTKLASVVGSGGIVRVNSWHHQGLSSAQQSKHLLASAYSLDDGLIEAVESPNHSWVIGVQFHPELRGEMPPHFDRLFEALVFNSGLKQRPKKS
tara:strand:- start:186 stop:911 length:726 start_codon:yes stop_codon:yes gene_type:complete